MTQTVLKHTYKIDWPSKCEFGRETESLILDVVIQNMHNIVCKRPQKGNSSGAGRFADKGNMRRVEQQADQ